MSVWSWAWLVWILVGVAIEIAALLRPAPGDTLSEHAWAVFANPTIGKFAAWMVFAFLIWLAVHFVSRGKWG